MLLVVHFGHGDGHPVAMGCIEEELNATFRYKIESQVHAASMGGSKERVESKERV